MKHNRKLNVELLVLLYTSMSREYSETGLYSLQPSNGVHIDAESLTDVAPLEQWKLNIDRGVTQYPFEHRITVHGVMFFAVSAEPIAIEPATILPVPVEG
jgi:hypothetical protein